MSTKCDTENFDQFCTLFDSRLNESYQHKDEAINVYSKFIKEGEKCLNDIKDVSAKHTLCQKLALGYNERGMVKYQKVDFDDAIDDFTKALSYNNQQHITFYNRGLIHYRLGRFDKAIDDMKNALELKSDFESAQKCLAQALTDKLNKS